MASLLDDVDVAMDNCDFKLIKEKIFKRLNGQGISTCELIEVYTIIQLDISFEDIDYLISKGKCIEIPRAIKTTSPLCWDDPAVGNDTCLPQISDLNLCKEYMFDKELFYAKYDTNISYYDHDWAVRDSLDHRVTCCYLSFSPDLEMEYMDYRKHNKKNKSYVAWSDMIGQPATAPCKSNLWTSMQGTTPLSSVYAKTIGPNIQAISSDSVSDAGSFTAKADMSSSCFC